MKNKKLYSLVAVVTVIVAVMIFWGIRSTPRLEAPVAEKLDGTEESGITYYYSRASSFSMNVQKFFDENKIEEKVVFSKKEVMPNTENSREMDMRAKECGLSEKETGIPFLYAGGKCFVGEEEIMEFFKKEAGVK